MRKQILNLLRKVEETENVHILYAVESGSRAWGFESTDSDYDVRFIYCRPINHYIKLDDKNDYIDKSNAPYVMDAEYNLDCDGWDLKKALIHLSRSNPNMLEWLRSPIQYIVNKKFFEKVSELAPLYYSKRAHIFHYISTASGNYKKYLQGDTVWTKKYFYVLRPLLACEWAFKFDTPPPLEFEKLLEVIPDKSLIPKIRELLRMKKSGVELDEGPKIPELHSFFDEQIGVFKAIVKKMGDNNRSMDKLNELFVSIVLDDQWNYRRRDLITKD